MNIFLHYEGKIGIVILFWGLFVQQIVGFSRIPVDRWIAYGQLQQVQGSCEARFTVRV